MEHEEDIPDEKWIKDERRKVVDYLAFENCRHAGVSDWPTFHAGMHLALWAVQSTKHAGRIGWWVISGDVPTDYMSSADGEQPQDALRHFAAQWAEMADCMKNGQPHPTVEMGDPKEWPKMGVMLAEWATILQEYADDEAIWD